MAKVKIVKTIMITKGRLIALDPMGEMFLISPSVVKMPDGHDELDFNWTPIKRLGLVFAGDIAPIPGADNAFLMTSTVGSIHQVAIQETPSGYNFNYFEFPRPDLPDPKKIK